MEIMGFIGLGKMGGNMAARYLAAGHAVYGEARDPSGSQWLIEKGLRWVDTPRQVADAVDIVMTSKDIRLARQAATDLATPLPTAAVADEMLTQAERLGYGQRDIAAVHEALSQLPTDPTAPG